VARAKSIERAEARRRYRAAHSVQAQVVASPDTFADEPRPATVDGPEPRRGIFGTLLTSFKRPNYRADLAAAPGIFVQRRLLWVPFLIILGTAAIYAASPVFSSTSGTASNSWEAMIVGLFLAQPMLLYFAVGYLSPRASYVFGAALGTLSSLLYVGILVVRVGTPTVGMTGTDLVMSLISYTVIQGVTGALMAAFAAWYRDFLRSTASKNRVRTEERKKLERREQRRPSKGSAQAR
jgi:hypothetical protein